MKMHLEYQVKIIDKILIDLHTEFLDIEKALKDLPEILKDKIKLISDTSNNVFILANNRKDIDKKNLYHRLRKLVFLTSEYITALQNSSNDFEKLLLHPQIKYKVLLELINFEEDYSLIIDENKVKQAFINLLKGDLLR